MVNLPCLMDSFLVITPSIITDYFIEILIAVEFLYFQLFCPSTVISFLCLGLTPLILLNYSRDSVYFGVSISNYELNYFPLFFLHRYQLIFPQALLWIIVTSHL